jgi:hypothetical protein
MDVARTRWVRAFTLAGCIAIGYVFLRPVGFNVVLLPVLAVIGLTSAATIVVGRRRPPRTVWPIPVALIVLGVYGSLVGAGNPGWWAGALVWIVAPILWGAWALAGDERYLRMILITSLACTILASAVLLVFVGGELGLIPEILPRLVQEQADLAVSGPSPSGGPDVTFLGLSTLVGAGPLWLSAAVLPRHPLLPRRGWSIAAGVLALATAFAAGRTALLVVTVLVPIAVWVVWRIISRRAPRTRVQRYLPVAIGAGAVAVVVALGATVARGSSERLFLFIAGQPNEPDDQVRLEQAGKLIEAWAGHPILGNGLGAVIDGYLRDHVRPWNFELQYHLILFQLGLVGAVVLLAVVTFAVVGIVRALRAHPDLVPVFLVASAAAVAMLIANASNPYLQAPGHQWAVYLPLFVVTAAASRRRENALPVDDA